jgi:hypothetical protein
MLSAIMAGKDRATAGFLFVVEGELANSRPKREANFIQLAV